MKSKEIKKPLNVFTVKKSSAGLGLFAKNFISKGSFVIEYTGEIITNEAADERGGKYLFNIGSKWTIDGKGRENLARYINHSCKPNCEAILSGKRVLINSIKNIKSGEELSYDYGKEYFDEFIKKYSCKCHQCQKRRVK